MSAPTVLVAGRVSRGPDRCQTSSGVPFTALTLRVEPSRNSCELWRVRAFSETTQAGLAGLAVGDGLAVAGRLQVEISERKRRLSFGVTASSVVPLGPNERAKLSLTVEPSSGRLE
jgi:hypothetical protein